MSETHLLKALVLEDEWPTRNYLVSLIEGSHRAEVVGAVASLGEAREAMAGEPSSPMFVLATASSQHSLEAFNLGVIDYLLKPFTDERVEQCLQRLLERRAPRSQGPRRVVARRKKSLVFLDPASIWAFEAADRLTFVHAPEGRFDIDLSLAAIESSFGRALFRVHRNWLVNLTYVRELERDIGGAMVTVGSDLAPEGQSIQVPVSQDRSKALRDVLLENATGLRRP